MRSYWFKTPQFVQRIFFRYAWRIHTNKKEIFLTFDDGPVPDFTPWVLDQLKAHKAKATFFCVGDNIAKHGEIYQRILDEGHSVGNHTFNHLQGWKTPTKKYVKNILKAESYLYKNVQRQKKLFRPPYGKIRPQQARALRKRGYQIVMWDVLSGDFDQGLSKEECLAQTKTAIRNGSIVVFHDSDKSFKNLDYVLPKLLKHFSEEGFRFEAL